MAQRRAELTRNTRTHELVEERRLVEENARWLREELNCTLMSLLDPLYEGNTRNSTPFWEKMDYLAPPGRTVDHEVQD